MTWPTLGNNGGGGGGDVTTAQMNAAIGSAVTEAAREALVTYMLKTRKGYIEQPDGSLVYPDYKGITNLVKSFPDSGNDVRIDYDYQGQSYFDLQDY